MNRPSVNINQFNYLYFLGIGGIGMSALARYFKSIGFMVAGYDKTSTELTQQLELEGINIHYEDLGDNIPEIYRNKEQTLVIYTPAIPNSLGEKKFFEANNFHLLKRAQVLGLITRNSKALGVAGTHGKTTTSTMLAHILHGSSQKCSAFLGGISTNYQSNFITDPEAEYTVIEADEFDRSFLQLDPFASIITTTDADHLDIYHNTDEFLEGFQQYASLIDPEGYLVRHTSVQLEHPNTITYGTDEGADYKCFNFQYVNNKFQFDLICRSKLCTGIVLGIPGIHNAENATACIALCDQLGIPEEDIRTGLASFKGIKRRFDIHVETDDVVYIDDYAHHPTEIKALIDSIQLLYPEKHITGIFQPHLFSRTRDFFDGFAKQLSRLDETILLPIYPAREEPIPGITSDALLDKIESKTKYLLNPEDAIAKVCSNPSGVILTIGAGDIDRIVSPIKKQLEQ